MHLNSLAASDAKESVVSLTSEGTGSSNNSHAQNYILLVLFEVDLCMKRNYFVRLVLSWERMFVLAVSEQKG